MNFQTNDDSILFLSDDGEVRGRVMFPEVEPGVVDVNETYVAPIERGLGLAGRMMGRAASHIRAQGKKARFSCDYAKKWFAEHTEYADIVAD